MERRSHRKHGARPRRWATLAATVLLAAPAVVLADGTLLGTPGNDVLAGTPTADSLFGLAGDDRLDGAAGNDDLDGGPGADDIHGSGGVDSVLYGGRGAAVAVTLDDVADDGEQGERDNVHADVEQVFGGDGGDRLNGSAGAEVIDGGGGDDSILDGGGTDRVYGGAGNDVITTFDADVDVVDCGPGSDTATADASDLLIGCEKRLPGPRIRTPVQFSFVYSGPRTTFTALVVRGLTTGSEVELRCRGGGCPSRTRINPKPGQSRVSLTSIVRGKRLLVGATLEVRVSAAQKIGRVERWVMRNGKGPRHIVLCLPPGSTTPRTKC